MIQHVQGGSLRARIVHVLCRIFVYTTLSLWPIKGPLSVFTRVVDLVFVPLPRLRSVRHEAVRGSSWRAELCTPRAGASGRGAVLYMHGGAFVFCGLNTHRRVTERLALRTGLPVLSVDYRQLPRGLYDDSVTDCVEAFDWLTAQGHAPGEIVLSGDSAGGHLSFAVALRLAQLGRGRVAGIAASSPWLDFDDVTKLAHDNARRDVFIPVRRLQEVAVFCLGTEEIDDSLSPVNADLSVLPEVLMLCAEDEVLRVDAELMHDRLEAAGVPVTLQVWSGMVHAFPVLANAIPESRRAVETLAEFTLRCIGAAGGMSEDAVA